MAMPSHARYLITTDFGEYRLTHIPGYCGDPTHVQQCNCFCRGSTLSSRHCCISPFESSCSGRDICQGDKPLITSVKVSMFMTLKKECLLTDTRCLASLHGLDYVTPSIVALAAKKVYRHRITVVSPEQDRSLLYGSDEAAVSKLLKGVTPDIIIENVLGDIEAPL